MIDNTQWGRVSDFYNGVIEEAATAGPHTLAHLEVSIYSPVRDETMYVTVPENRVENFMKHLALWEVQVCKGRPQN